MLGRNSIHHLHHSLLPLPTRLASHGIKYELCRRCARSHQSVPRFQFCSVLIQAIISIITWVVDGRKNFIGPRDLHVLLDLAKSGQAEQVELRLQSENAKVQ